MAVLVTGGAGFVGFNVVQALLERGDDVVLFDMTPLPAGGEGALERQRNRPALERGSVMDADALEALFRKHRVDRVVHAAAVTSGPGRETQDPASVLDVNVRGTINVLDAARRCGVERVVYVGSAAAYGESLYKLPRLYEDSASVPTTLYSITKHAAERTCLRLRELWNIDVACVRLGTVIGPWERDTGARDNFGTHSQLAALAVAGKTAILPPREIQRDWVYVRDVASGLIQLLEAPSPAHRVYNLSSGYVWDRPVATWCERLKAAYPRFSFRAAVEREKATVTYTDRDRGVMGTRLIEQDLDFRPRYPMNEAYDDYIAWRARTPAFYGV